MAFVANDPNAQNQPPAAGQPGANPLSMQAPVTTSTAPGAGPAASGGTGTSTPSNQTPAQPFANIQSYLTANAPQISQMGQTIADQQGGQFGKVQGDINAGAASFQNDVNAGYAAPNADLTGRVATNPTDVAANPADTASFQALFNDAYTGPTSFETSPQYALLVPEVQNAASNANLLNTPSGIQTYLTSLESNPTQGDTTLDQVLLSGNPQAIQQIQQAAAPVAGLPGYLSAQVPTEDAAVQAAQTAAGQGKTAAQGAVTSAATDLTNQVQAALTAAQTKLGQNGTFTAIQTAINNGQPLTPDQAAAIGIDPAAYQTQLGLIQQESSIYNDFAPNLGAYFTPGQTITTPPSAATVASPSQYAEAAALAKLAGNFAPNLPINPSDSALAGTFNGNPNPPSLNLSKATQDVATKFLQQDAGVVSQWADHPGTPQQQAQEIMTTIQLNSGNPGYPQNIIDAAKRILANVY